MAFGMPHRAMGLYPGTPAEHAIEGAIASLGVKYRWQYPLYCIEEEKPLRYFPDFAIWIPATGTATGKALKVCLEVDDPSHDTKEKRAADAERTRHLRSKGWTVVRCLNEDAIRYPVATVNKLLRQIGVTLTATPPEREKAE